MRQILLLAFVLCTCCLNAQKDSVLYWLGKSTGKLPALAFGLGDDRLAVGRRARVEVQGLEIVEQAAQVAVQSAGRADAGVGG